MQNFQGHRRRSLTAALMFTTSAAVLLSAEGAWAQAAAANPAAPLPEAAAAPEANAVEAVVVTGSRLQAGFQAPTPVTVVGTAQIQTRAPADVYDIVSQLPSFKNSSGPSNNSYGIQNASQANLDLRGLGSTRTLTLIDGARHVATNQTNNVDTNIIPTMFIERVDTVTGGASAAYGSDAVAGVVNFIINTHLNGLQGQAYYGFSQQGDNREKSGNLAYGTDFAGDRKSVV